MFAVELAARLAAGSVSLLADSLDVLGDAFVYGLSIYAVASPNFGSRICRKASIGAGQG